MSNFIRRFHVVSENQFNEDFQEFDTILEDIKTPRRATKGSAGYDFYAPFDIVLQPLEEIKIPTGIKAEMLQSDCLMLFPRSSLGFKFYLKLANTVGIVDADYFGNKKNEGHIFIKMKNGSDKIINIKKGEAFAQGIFMNYRITNDDAPVEEIRQGGMGSTNVNEKKG